MVAPRAIIDRSVARIDLTDAELPQHILPHAKLTSPKKQEQKHASNPSRRDDAW